MKTRIAWQALFLVCTILCPLCPTARGEESPDAARERHRRVAERRERAHIICHRGAAEFAHENTLEAYRAALELGADGNEIDIRQTKDGVLVCFHDDMLDRLLVAYGDVADLTWAELQRAPFRDLGRWGPACRIPTLAEVFDLHRHYAGLLHLDIKRPGLDAAIGKLLDAFDLWDHVAYCHQEHGGVLLRDPRLKLLRYKASLYTDHGELFPRAIQAALAKPGDGVIVDDPRGVIRALGRPLGKLSELPVTGGTTVTPPWPPRRDEATLVKLISNATDWNQPAVGVEAEATSALRIMARAKAADELSRGGPLSAAALQTLQQRVRERSLHRHWMYHGLDGALALRTLLARRAPESVELARSVIWRDDPALAPVVNPEFHNPRSWTDFRLKMLVFPALATHATPEAAQLCRDYLALSDEAARALGPEQFEAAAQALMRIAPTRETADTLLRHRLTVVQGRAILECLTHATSDWSLGALREHAPHALDYIVPLKIRAK